VGGGAAEEGEVVGVGGGELREVLLGEKEDK